MWCNHLRQLFKMGDDSKISLTSGVLVFLVLCIMSGNSVAIQFVIGLVTLAAIGMGLMAAGTYYSQKAIPRSENGEDFRLSSFLNSDAPLTDRLSRFSAAVATNIRESIMGENEKINRDPSVSLQKGAPKWKRDSTSKACSLCSSAFTLLKRRHHCRRCGSIFCAKCCPKAKGSKESERLCLTCVQIRAPRPDEAKKET